MKKFLFSMICALFPILASAQEQEPYALLSENNTVLTFYYDDQKAAQGGLDIEPFNEASERGWDEQKENIQQVVFHESFATCTTISSTSYWFYGFNHLTTITDLNNLKTDNVEDMSGMFEYCSSLTILDVSGFKTQNVTSMSRMFYGCYGLTSLDVSGFDTENVTNMKRMFDGCSSLTSLDVNGFNTENVTNMSGMFGGCKGLTSLDVSGFNTSNVTDMSDMFAELKGEQISLDLSNFNTSNVTDMSEMFVESKSLTSINLSSFNTSNVTNMEDMFAECPALTSLDLSSFNTSNVTNMGGMFRGNPALTTISVGNSWSTAVVTNGNGMFSECSALVGGAGTTYDENHTDHTYAHVDGGVSNPGYFTNILPYAVLSENNTVLTFYYDDQKEARGGMSIGPFTNSGSREWEDNVTTITTVEFEPSFADCRTITSTARWFDGCSNLTSISGINYLYTANVTSMRRMFKDCSSLTSLDVTGFNTEKVTSMDYMFDGCSSLASLDVRGFNTENVTNMESMFASCSSLTTLDVTSFNTANATNISRMFYSCSDLTSLDLSSFNTENVTDMSHMFSGCSGLTRLDLSGFNTENVTNMTEMFEYCYSLTNLDVSGFNTSNVTKMEEIFAECTTLTSLDLSSFNTSNVTNMNRMFDRCSSLTTIYAGEGWSTENISSEDHGAGMFRECTSLVGGAGTTYNGNHEDYTYAHIDEGTSNPGYLTDGFGDRPYALLSENNTVLTFYYDNQKVARGGMDVGPFEYWGGQGISSGWNDFNEQITTVVFDESFANCTTLTNTAYWFYGCENLTTITGISNLNTDHVTDINSMFSDCHSLKSIDFSSLNLSKVTNMHQVFEDCRSLESINFSGVNTENVTNMGDLFLNCRSLKTIDISSFNTGNVTKMTSMFYKCDVLTTIYVGEGWTTENVTESAQMFEHSPNLVGGRGTQYDANHVGIEYAHIDGGTSNPGYLTDINGASEEAWAELYSAIEYGTDVLSRAKESSGVDPWLVEELEMYLERGNEMYNEHSASEDEVRNMTEELNHFISEVEEAMRGGGGASDEAWAELNEAVKAGDQLLTEARGVSTVEPWALEELENMTVKGSQMYEEHTAGEEEVRHMSEELRHIINEVEEMMRQQPQGEALFDGLTAWISGSYTLDNAFESVGGRAEAAKTIAAIVWNADGALTADMLKGIDNPNLLVFVTEALKAPAGVQNVVINSVAEKIILTDASGNNNFYSPQSFTAKSISYSRDFSQTTEIEVCRGWETIALPFDVQSITHESHGTLVPFGSDNNGYPFWLRQLSANGLTRATQIKANKPYLICMPNSDVYPPAYNQNGKVTFSSSNIIVPETLAQSDSYAGVTLHAAFQQVAQGNSVYALNVGEARGEYPEGSVFEQNYRNIQPFQAYTTHSAGTRGFISLGSLGGDDDATGIEESRIQNSELMNSKGYWYSLDGRRLEAKPTKKGVYVKDGRKIVIK